MSNSAFTPSTNLAIPATTTQAGTVTTVDQTFAGNKTFNGIVAAAGGLVFTTASLSDVQATRLGLKQYLHGTTYNGGLAPTVTCGQAGFAVVRAVFVPYQVQDGSWRLRFNMSGTFTSNTLTTFVYTVAGIASKAGTNNYQSVTALLLTGNATLYQSYIGPNSNSFALYFSSSSQNGAMLSGDIELESKPTWAY